MKRVIVLKEGMPSFMSPHLLGVFTSTQIAYDYLNDYLEYLKTDAEMNLGGDWLKMELLRINIAKESIKEILQWDLNDDAKLLGMSFCGFEIDTILCFENEEDLWRNQKKTSPVELSF